MSMERHLCPHCHGDSDACQFCDGGWIVSADENLSEKAAPVRQIADPVIASEAKRFKPVRRRIQLGDATGSERRDLQLLQRATASIAAIEKAEKVSTQAYKDAAEAAYKLIRTLLKECKTDVVRAYIQKRLNAAFYHRKQAQLLIAPIPRKPPRSDNAKTEIVRKSMPEKKETAFGEKLRLTIAASVGK